jgi:protocatechuate 3,4-dioxygenase beta subunit
VAVLALGANVTSAAAASRGHAARPFAAASPLVSEGSTLLEGRIVDSSGSPVSGAGVSVTSSEGGSESVSTDESGDYSFELPPGTYRLNIGASEGGYSVDPIVENITVSEGATTTENVKLPPIGTMTFVVTNSKGQAAPNVRLTATSTGGAYGSTEEGSTMRTYAYPGPTAGGPCVTDEHGECTLHYLAGAPVGFEVNPPSGLSTTTSGTASAEGSTIDVQLPPSGAILEGRIEDSSGDPVSGAGVSVTSSKGSTVSTSTDESGDYSFELPPGTYRINIGTSEGGYSVDPLIENVTVSEEAPKVENVKLPPIGTMTFVVTSSKGQPAPNVRLTATSTGGAYGSTEEGTSMRTYAYPGPTASGPCVTDEQGECTLRYLAGAPVGFEVAPPGGLSTTASGTASAEGSTIDVQLPPSGAILEGRIEDSSGNPVAGAGVSVTSSKNQSVSTSTDSSGDYSFSLPPGTYRLNIGASEGGYSVDPLIENVTVSEEAPKVENVKLPPIGTMRFVVTDSHGHAAPGVRLTATSTGGAYGSTEEGTSMRTYAYPGPTASGPCVTDEQGECTLRYLAGAPVGFEVNPPGGLSSKTSGTASAEGATIDLQLANYTAPEVGFTVTAEQRVGASGEYTANELEAKPGETVDYLVTVTDTGSRQPISLEAIADAGCETISGPSRGSLGADGETATYTCEHQLTEDGVWTNAATVEVSHRSLKSNEVTVEATGLGSQQITFDTTAPASPVVGTVYTVGATSSSGLPVAFSIDATSTKKACAVSSDVVTFTHSGTCIVDADQGGNASFGPAPQGQQTIDVAAGNASTSTGLSLSSSSVEYGNEQALTTSVTVTAAGGGTVASGKATVRAGKRTLCQAVIVDGSGSCSPKPSKVKAGDYQVTATFKAGHNLEASTSGAESLEVQ